jgi:hypothetical protein
MRPEQEKYGLTEEEWEAYEEKFGEIILSGLIKYLSSEFRRKYLLRKLHRDSEVFTIPVERGINQTTLGVNINGRELQLLARAGKKMEDVVEGKGRGIVKRIRSES